jgi:hypothetical protein
MAAASTVVLGCARDNPGFDELAGDDAGTTAADTNKPPGDGDGGDASVGGTGVSTSGVADTGVATGIDDGPISDTGMLDTGFDEGTSTGVVDENRILVFAGPTLWSDAVGKSALSTWQYGQMRCEQAVTDNGLALECPHDQVWALLGADDNPLSDYPSLPNGQYLDNATVYGAHTPDVPLAESFEKLVVGELLVPFVGAVVDGAGEHAYWWGFDANARVEPAASCSNWATSVEMGAYGRAAVGDDVDPWLQFVDVNCGQALPILCICF